MKGRPVSTADRIAAAVLTVLVIVACAAWLALTL